MSLGAASNDAERCFENVTKNDGETVARRPERAPEKGKKNKMWKKVRSKRDNQWARGANWIIAQQRL